MCVYSCEKTSRSQSSVLPIVLSERGGTAWISIRSYGTGVAQPFDRS